MSDDAEEAFDLLRGEVTLLRRAVEGLLADPVKIPPEVSRQLRAQSAELKRLADETRRIAECPQLSLSPEAFPEYLRRMSALVSERLGAPWNQTLADLRSVGAQFARYGERARDRDAQRQQLVLAAVGGALAALAVWITLSGPIARALPEKWFVAERLAAATLDQDRWEAGQKLMGSADQEAWRRWVIAFDLYTLNNAALSRCAKGNALKGIARRCDVELPSSMSK